jgi:hypothetical protein
MFVLTNLKFCCIYNNNIVFIPSHLSNYREFIKYESEQDKNINNYTSSVQLTSKNVEVNITLNKDFTTQLQTDISYDVEVSFFRFDQILNKNIYKICKIVLSENDVEFSEEHDDDEKILEDYEICEMFEKSLSDVKQKILAKQEDLDELLYRIDNLGKTIDNLNLLTDINEYLEGEKTY